MYKNSILKASFFVALLVVIGKFFGFARDSVIAAYYGADAYTDVFFFAQSMPSIVFPAICNSVATAFITVYVAKLVKSEVEAEFYANKILYSSMFSVFVLSGLVAVLCPLIIPYFAPGFNYEQILLSVRLTRFILMAFFMTMGYYILSAILSSKKQYIGPQLAALCYNCFIIIFTVFFAKTKDMDMLTLTVVLGCIVQFFVMIYITKKNFPFVFIRKFFDEDYIKLIRISFPIILGNSIVQINNIVDKILSSMLTDGAISALSYSNNLNRFVTGIFITTITAVLYPRLSENISKNNFNEFSKNINNTFIITAIILLPISLLTYNFASDIVSIVYKRGVFNEKAVSLTASALVGYSFMYIFIALQEIAAKSFYSMNDMKTPVRVSAYAVMANSFVSFILCKYYGIIGIALGTTISSILAGILLLHKLQVKVRCFKLNKMLGLVLKISMANICSLILINVRNTYIHIEDIYINFFFNISLYCIFYLLILYISKIDEINIVVNNIKKKLR